MVAAPCRAESGPALPDSVLRRDVCFLTDSLHTGGRVTGTVLSQGAISYIHRAFKNAGLWSRVQSFACGGKVGHNVIAVTPGYFKKYIVVGAYMDGIGTIDGTYYPGADSNASGVACMLGIARNLARKCKGDTGIVFVAFDGHRADLSGSRSFVEKYLPGRRITMMINLDTIGSSLAPVDKDKPQYLIVLGGKKFINALESAGAGLGISLFCDYYGSSKFTELFYRSISDQKWFLQKNIASIMFTSGITEHTNKASDTPDKLDYPLLAGRTQLISGWIGTLI